MDQQQDSIIKYSNEILDNLLEFKKSHPDFTFSLRQRDFAQTNGVKRLEAGQWFQGSDYIYVPLFKKGDSARKIKTLGFTIVFDKSGNITNSSITISFKSGVKNENEITFHKQLASKIGLELNEQNYGDKYFENPQDIFTNLNYFITDVRNYALSLLEELELLKEYIYSESDFQKCLNRINEIKLEALSPKKEINYWVFQGSPKIYNIVGALKANAIKTWTVSAHKNKIKVGDKLILWMTGNNSGCFALGRITSPVTYMKEEDSEMDFYLKPTEQIDNNRVSIEIEHNYCNSPILWENIKDDEVFKDFNGGNQGTNFTATKEQYETLLDLASSNSDSAYAAVKKVLDQEKLKSFLTILRDFVKSNTINADDERISFNVRENKRRLVFIIGNRYALCIQKRNSTTEMSFISKDILSKTSEDFRNPNGKIEAYWNTFENLKGYEKNINEGFLIELDRNNKCPHRKYINQDFINDIYSNQTNTIKFIVANITWNSKDWKEVSEDDSGHAWVGGENIPHESWNFDFDNPRNKNGNVLGFAKFTNAPKLEGDKNLVIFYSKGKIVGFYGKATILKKCVDISDKESYNLVGDKNLSIVLKNKLDNIKEKGYLENKERVGQVGFSYLEKTETALNILDAAINLNPEQHQVLKNIKEWILENTNLQSNSNNGNMESLDKTTALNQILYGPPGTGKTYNTVLEAAKIVTGNELISYDEALVEFNKKLGNQIEFITFHQNYSYEDFIQGIRPDTENGKELTFEKKDGVFKRIADRALRNWIDSEKPESAKKDFDAVFQDFMMPLMEEDEIEVKMKKTSFYITQISEKSIEFRKNQGDSQHTLSINTLRKMYNDGFNEIILGGLQPYYNPILSLLLEKGKSQFMPVEKKNFVIIIDEINRANISRVFGELITLIEKDKRSHGKIPMRVTLPSGDSFMVPSNLYIIGTMNTADKSIALLDIALRRRFDFVAKYPEVSLVKPEYQEIFSAINKAILDRKNHDFTIGHAYFMEDDCTLENTINNKVIPLLLEYFMNDEKEVAAILQAAKITIGDWPLKMLS